MAKKKKKIDSVLIIDAGTQSIRAAIIDIKGNIVDIVKTQIEPYYSDHPGWAEQDPLYYWKVFCKTCKQLIKNMSVDINFVKGVSLTTQRDTMINLDKKGKPLRPAIVWLDQRRAKVENWPPSYLKFILKGVNLYDSVKYSITESESNWIRQNQPAIWEKTDKFVFLSGYFNFKLTGEYVDSTGNQVGFVPFDYKKHDWAKAWHPYWKMFPMEKDLLPTLVKPGETMEQISKKASKETGIPEGLPLIAAATDKACEVLGSGCLTPEIACLSFGTTATIETTNSKYIEIMPFFPPFPSAVPGFYNTEIMIYRGYWMVNWFKKEFGLREEQIAKKKNIAPEVLFDNLIKDIPPGSMGLTLQPYWSPGVKIPGPEAKGSIIGFGDVHTRAHIYRAILEGLSYGLKEGLLRTEHRSNVNITKLRVSGGGSQSNVALQLTADIFNMPAERPHTFETSALGAAIDAAVGLNFYSDFPEAVNNMTRLRDIFEPDKKNSEIYGELFEKVYLKMYKQLRPLYNDIRHITGYPELR